MYRIRLHGRGGQGMKTASRILGSAFFAKGFEVQDAPRYGAERRGAPVFAYVRASRRPIHERGVIQRPDLVAVADEGLVPIAAAGVLQGLGPRTVLLLGSDESADVWKGRLHLEGKVLVLPTRTEKGDESESLQLLGTTFAAAAARCVGVLSRPLIEEALRLELADVGRDLLARNLECAIAAWNEMEPHEGCVSEGPECAAGTLQRPDWIDLPLDAVDIAAPDIHATETSLQVRTGLWRTMRPLIDRDLCHQCHWICSTFCPDAAISVDSEGMPEIDYEHCKGCLVCVAVCPVHSIRAIPERAARAQEAGETGP